MSPCGQLFRALIITKRWLEETVSALGRPGSDLLSHVLRRSIIGAEKFNGRVRNGIGFRLLAIATKPAKRRNWSMVILLPERASRMRVIKPIERLVPVSFTHCCASTPGLSNSSSWRGLLRAEARGRSHLGVGFPLRCLQRLSRPHVAIRRCRWRDNRCTRGASVPVLSY